MHRLLRYYSQNRIRVWKIIGAIVFVIAATQVLNQMAKNNIQQRAEEIKIEQSQRPTKEQQEQQEALIDEFYTYCVNHEPEKAYDLLTLEEKENKYPTLEQFKELYYTEEFDGNKEYNYTYSKNSNGNYIYQVKITNNLLATGKWNDEYIEEYVTIIQVDNSYKLSISNKAE